MKLDRLLCPADIGQLAVTFRQKAAHRGNALGGRVARLYAGALVAARPRVGNARSYADCREDQIFFLRRRRGVYAERPGNVPHLVNIEIVKIFVNFIVDAQNLFIFHRSFSSISTFFRSI